jgi:hypothetical protein
VLSWVPGARLTGGGLVDVGQFAGVAVDLDVAAAIACGMAGQPAGL